MKRKTFFIISTALIAVLVIVGAFVPKQKQESDLTGELATLTSNPSSVSKTVAICNEDNFCQDYNVVCQDGEEISREPIPSSAIQKPEDWIDERNIDYGNLCG